MGDGIGDAGPAGCVGSPLLAASVLPVLLLPFSVLVENEGGVKEYPRSFFMDDIGEGIGGGREDGG